MQLTLTHEISDALIEAAEQQGTTPEILALSCLQQHFLGSKALESQQASETTEPEANKQSLADFLEGYIGVLSSKQDNLENAKIQQQSTPSFTQYLMQKRDQGKL